MLQGGRLLLRLLHQHTPPVAPSIGPNAAGGHSLCVCLLSVLSSRRCPFAAQVKIEASRPIHLGHGRTLSALARYPNGEPIPYILYQEFHLPGSIDSSAATTQQAMQTWCQAQSEFSKMQSSAYYQQKK